MARQLRRFFSLYFHYIYLTLAVIWNNLCGLFGKPQLKPRRCWYAAGWGERQMKTGFLAVLLVLLGAGTAFAGSCVTDTYDNYVGNSCTISVNPPGDIKTFSNFSYSASGTSHMPDNQITVNPINFAFNAGFLFNAPWIASPNQTQTSMIGFTTQISSGSALIDDLSLLMFGGGVAGTGTVSVSETYCLGDTFSDGCAHGTTGTLSTFLNSKGSQLVATVKFAGVSEVDVEKTIQVSGGSSGFAVLSGVENLVSEDPPKAPEPGSLATLASSLIAMAGLMGRRLFA